MFVGDVVFPGEVHWGTICPLFVGDVVFPVKFTGAPDAVTYLLLISDVKQLISESSRNVSENGAQWIPVYLVHCECNQHPFSWL